MIRSILRVGISSTTAASRRAVIPVMILVSFLRPSQALPAAPAIDGARGQATSNAIAYCDGDYHGLSYCEFTAPFSVPTDRVVDAIKWYDLGCASPDQETMTLVYDLATAEPFTIVEETTESVQLECAPSYPLQHNVPTTLPIHPATLVAGRPYFLLLRSLDSQHSRAFWGTDGSHRASFKVLSAETGHLAVQPPRLARPTPIAILPREIR